jgi:hypothetical protein
MPILGILGALLYFGCIFHAIKTGCINYWLMILVLVPGIGSVAYLLLEVLPAARGKLEAADREWIARAEQNLEPTS